MDSYFTLFIQGVRPEDEDLLTHFLFEGGAGGVQEDLKFEQVDRSYLPKVIEVEIKNLIAYFESPPSPQWIEELQVQYPHIQFQFEEHQREDWLQKWKDQWKPFELTTDIWIVPEWLRESFSPKRGQCLFIEPGMAFGTGTHATTQLAAQLIVKAIGLFEIHSLLDVGTGSGILALLAAHLGVENVHAYDNDPECLRVMRENQEKNGQPKIYWQGQWASDLMNNVDLTVANIIDGVLLDLKPEFQKVNSPYYIFTGILQERDLAFQQEMFLDWSLQIVDRIEKEEWVGYLLEQKA